MLKLTRQVSCGLLGVVCAVGSVAAGLPAFGQGSDGFTVIGRTDTPSERRVSATISYQDLDLTNADGRAALQHRVWKAGQKLCSQMGERSLGSASTVMSCADQVRFSADPQQRDAIARAKAPTAANYASAASGAPTSGSSVLTISVAAAK
jgi:UrcA family protein